MSARATGEILIKAKARMRHGEFLPWLDRTTGIAPRMAQTYMQLAHELPMLPAAKAQRVARLSLRGAIAEVARRSRKVPPPPPLDRALTNARREALERGKADTADRDGCPATATGNVGRSPPTSADPTAPPPHAELVHGVLEHVRSYRRDRPGITVADLLEALHEVCRQLDDGGAAAEWQRAGR